jgi:hypothetical protein
MDNIQRYKHLLQRGSVHDWQSIDNLYGRSHIQRPKSLPAVKTSSDFGGKVTR